ncbi:MAG TPA: hypothetical protein VME86_13745 [Acidobacteriaceae bacterium]|nr:hypothetical protein [Acidobacteriaceae bacterium]
MKGLVIPVIFALAGLSATAQVFTVTPENVNAKYLEFTPTNVQLPTLPLTHHDREDLLRYLQAEQGFTMRPLPVANLTLPANGEMKPNGSDYANLIQKKGLAAEAGKRVVITNVNIDDDRIVIDFDGGPYHKHRWLRHFSIGMDPYDTTPVVQDQPNEATGARVTLVFEHGVPDLTGMQVEALLKPIVDFSLKTPLQAYTDTLPPFLREAILQHHVLVGMNHKMVLSAMGEPWQKMHEEVNNQYVEIWIYGKPPDPTQFVRFVANRVIRLEIARVGEPIEVHAKNEMRDYWSKQLPANAQIIQLGDQNPSAAAQQNAPAAPPSLRNPGETLPADQNKNTPQMQPVEFPKDTGGSQPSSGSQQQTQPTSTPQSQPAPSQAPPSQNPSQPLLTTASLP